MGSLGLVAVLLVVGLGGLLLIPSLRRRIHTMTFASKGKRKATRILFEDALKHIYKCELRRTCLTPQSLAGQIGVGVDQAASIIGALQKRKLMILEGSILQLTKEGRDYATHIIRAHRLWELYLADRTGVAETDWHGQAERLEHEISPAEAEQLSASLGHPTHDPHGDPVPTSKGSLRSVGGISLLSMEPDQWARVVHVEDEPESVYAQLVSEGLIAPGLELKLVDRDKAGIHILVEGRHKTLSPLVAGNLTVRKIDEADDFDYESANRLSELEAGEKGVVLLISRTYRAVERRRLMDLGILPGTTVEAEFVGPSGDPTAYRIRGALIALRKEQAEQIFVKCLKENAA